MHEKILSYILRPKVLLAIAALGITLAHPGRLTAQEQHTVTGAVMAQGLPLADASVQVKGTSAGATTDKQGRFSIAVQPGGELEISRIGYEPVTVPVNGRHTITIVLREAQQSLDEVVVIGYGTQKKKLLTGANIQVSGDDIKKQNQLNPLQGLQGRAAGVNITSTSGQPGSDMKVVIRGLGTIGNSGPLYVIDGIPGGDIAVLNPADILSIDILKDAASAAIYGAQAANGVVLVTTRTGRPGTGQVSFDGYKGVQSILRKARLLNAAEYKVIMNEQALNSGSAPIDFDAMDGLADTDWLDQMITKNAGTESYSLGLNGGSDATVYSLSLNYINQEGIVGGKAVSGYQRYGFRSNAEHRLYNNVLKIGQHLNFNYTLNNGIQVGNQYSNTFRGAFATSPLSPVYSDNNLFDSPFNDTQHSPWYNGDGNPYAEMMTNSNNRNNGQRLMGDIYAELEPVRRLKLKSVFGINYYASEYRSFTPLYQFSVYAYNTDHTTISQNTSKGHNLLWTNTATYDLSIGDHSVNAMIGMEAQRFQGTYLSGSNWNLLSQFNDFSHAYLSNTTGKAHVDDNGNIVETREVGGKPENQYRRLSYFGRIGYNYQEKYLFNATLRRDGSSKFAEGYRWGWFPSFSAGWVLSAENFMSPSAGWLSFLKLRASWGQVGNQDIDDFQFTAPVNTSTNYSSSDPAAFYTFGTGGINVPGAYPSRLSNPGIHWETSEQTDIGIDARLLSGRLELTADYYVKSTKGWLVTAPILATAGAGAPVINGGSVKNQGIEWSLNWNQRSGDLSYRAGFNGAYNKNRVGRIPTEDGIIHGLTNMLYNNSEEFYRAENGHAIGYFRGYQTAGLFQSLKDINDWTAAGNGVLQGAVRPGDVKYVDQDHNNRIDDNDKIDLGSGLPTFTYGFNLGIDYKGFDFSVYIYGVAGNKLVQSYRNHANKQANYTTAILDRWTGSGTSDRMPRVTETNINWQFSDLYLQDGDFLRLSTLTLGYDLSRLVTWKYPSRMHLYVQGQNLLTFTKYDGMDPEIGYGTEGWVSGVDLGYYPRPSVLLLGVNLNF